MMTAAEHVNCAGSLVYQRVFAKRLDRGIFTLLEAALLGPGLGAQLSSARVPWSRNDIFSSKRDGDGDGISDSLDGYFGPGAVPPFGRGGRSVPWSRDDTLSNKRDSDRDGIPDSLDGFSGQGTVPPFGRGGRSVPWDRNDAFSNKRDGDDDGIADSLDGYFGEGAVPPFDPTSIVPLL